MSKALKLGPLMGSLAEIKARYGEDFDAQSHGESFLSLFRNRFVTDGLYLMDEPEAALSDAIRCGATAVTLVGARPLLPAP